MAENATGVKVFKKEKKIFKDEYDVLSRDQDPSDGFKLGQA